MPNTIKTSADQIVEKYRPYVSEYNERTDTETGLDNATRCAILEVEACIDTLRRFSIYWDLLLGSWHMDEMDKLELLKQELKSRIV